METPPDKKNVDEFVRLAAWSLAGVYEFNGDILTVSVMTVRGPQYGVDYKLLSRQDNEIKYVGKGPKDSTTQTLTVYVLSDKNIKIVSEKSLQGAYLLWKRVEKIQTQMRSDEMQAWSSEWMKSLEKISEFLNRPINQKSANNK